MKTALITGASQGIGAAIADKLNDKKIKVCHDLQETCIQQVCLVHD